MQGDTWIIEIYDRDSRRWYEEGTPEEDFGKLWRESEELARRGYKARVVKIGKQAREEEYFGPETPELKMPTAQTPEDNARRIGCTSKRPFECEYCTERSCPVTVDAILQAEQEASEK